MCCWPSSILILYVSFRCKGFSCSVPLGSKQAPNQWSLPFFSIGLFVVICESELRPHRLELCSKLTCTSLFLLAHSPWCCLDAKVFASHPIPLFFWCLPFAFQSSMECTQSLRNGTSALESMKPSNLPYHCSCNSGILRSLWKLPLQLKRLNWLGKSLDCWFSTCQLQSCSGHDCRAQPRNPNCWPASWVSILSCKAERRRLMFLPGWERLSRLIWLSFHTYH